MKKAILAISALIASSLAYSAGSGIEGYWGYNDKVDPYNPQPKIQQSQQNVQYGQVTGYPQVYPQVYPQAYSIQQPIQGYYYIPIPIGQMPAVPAQMASPSINQQPQIQQQAILPPTTIPGSNAIIPPNGIPVVASPYGQENQVATPVKQNEQPVSIRVISLSKDEYEQSIKNPIVADTLEDAIRAKSTNSSNSDGSMRTEVPSAKKVYKLYNPKTQEVTEIVK